MLVAFNFARVSVSEANLIEKANDNYLFANKNKVLGGGLKIILKYPLLAVLLFLFSFTACEGTERPIEVEKLPFGVFPLNDVSWVHIQYWGLWGVPPDDERIYDTEGKLIATIVYISSIDTLTYSVRQVGENKAELYCSKATTWSRTIWDNINKTNSSYGDTTWTTAPELYGKIYLEDKRVYFDHSTLEGPWYKNLLLYDFSLNVGDEFIANGYKYIVVSIDSVLVGNEYRKKYNFELTLEGFPRYKLSVIEGIGCPQNLFHTLGDPFMAIDPLPPVLREVYYKDRKIWEREGY